MPVAAQECVDVWQLVVDQDDMWGNDFSGTAMDAGMDFVRVSNCGYCRQIQGRGQSEESIPVGGSYTSPNDCEDKVHEMYPEADGMTWKKDGGKCWAEKEMTNIDENQTGYKSCLFDTNGEAQDRRNLGSSKLAKVKPPSPLYTNVALKYPKRSEKCPKDMYMCRDYTIMARDPKNNCEFHPCPEKLGCRKDTKVCPSGATVSRDPNDAFCRFTPCSAALVPEPRPTPLIPDSVTSDAGKANGFSTGGKGGITFADDEPSKKTKTQTLDMEYHLKNSETDTTVTKEESWTRKERKDKATVTMVSTQETSGVVVKGFAVVGFSALMYGAYMHFFGQKPSDSTHLEMA